MKRETLLGRLNREHDELSRKLTAVGEEMAKARLAVAAGHRPDHARATLREVEIEHAHIARQLERCSADLAEAQARRPAAA